MFEARYGVYPTMITPYKEGKIDFEAVRRLTEWYWKMGCDGIFAACQSSEIMFLSLKEKTALVREVVSTARELARKDKSREPMMIVASGHTSDSFEEQVRELNAVAAEKPDALILISNRMDIENTSDEKWIADTEKLIAHLPEDMPLGVYECPKPYKRLLNERMINRCAESGRFYFIKDTCCDAQVIKNRLDICRGTSLKIFNANAQTLLETMRAGAHGYCGVMANFHPDLYVRLLHGDLGTKEASLLGDFLSLAANIESYCYPCCAKYHLDRHEGIAMSYEARSADVNDLTAYKKACVDQLAELTNMIRGNRNEK